MEQAEKAKPAYKPGSVRGRTSVTVIPLGHKLPGGSSDLPESGASHAIALLFGLAPNGVCHAVTVTGDAVGSYPQLRLAPAAAHVTVSRAIAPLPARIGNALGRCIFCCTVVGPTLS